MQRKYDDAITWADEALKINQYHLDSLNLKAGCLFQIKQIKIQYECYKGMMMPLYGLIKFQQQIKTIQMHQIQKLVHYIQFKYFIILIQLQKFENALTPIDQALNIEPNDTFFLLKKGDCLYYLFFINLVQQLKKYKEAITQYDKVLNFHPKFEVALTKKNICQQQLKYNCPIM